MTKWKWNKEKILEIARQIYEKNKSLSCDTWKKELGYYPNGSIIREFGSLNKLEKLFYSEIKISKEIVNLNKREQQNKELKEKAKELIGNECLVCGKKEHLVFHQKHGKPHNRFGKSGLKYYVENHKDFITLCLIHHRLIHELAKLDEKKFYECMLLTDLLREYVVIC